MTRAETWFSHAATAVVGVTGVVYGWMRYFAEPADEFAVVNHPWQDDWQALHILFAPLVVFACGLIWRNHVWTRIRSGFAVRRRGGIGLASLFLPMAASGYVLQVSSNAALTRVAVIVHVATSCAWMVVYVGHQLSARRTASFARVRWGSRGAGS